MNNTRQQTYALALSDGWTANELERHVSDALTGYGYCWLIQPRDVVSKERREHFGRSLAALVSFLPPAAALLEKLKPSPAFGGVLPIPILLDQPRLSPDPPTSAQVLDTRCVGMPNWMCRELDQTRTG